MMSIKLPKDKDYVMDYFKSVKVMKQLFLLVHRNLKRACPSLIILIYMTFKAAVHIMSSDVTFYLSDHLANIRDEPGTRNISYQRITFSPMQCGTKTPAVVQTGTLIKQQYNSSALVGAMCDPMHRVYCCIQAKYDFLKIR